MKSSVLIDSRLPRSVKRNLSKKFHLVEFPPSADVYPDISAHPDIFVYEHHHSSNQKEFIVAQNTPDSVISELKKINVIFETGEKKTGNRHPQSVYYNAVSDRQIFLHRLKFSDSIMLQKEKQSGKKLINVSQGYTRCSCLLLPGKCAVTSDIRIGETLRNIHYQVFMLNPRQIRLSDKMHGFAGGCMGFHHRTVYITGGERGHSQASLLAGFLKINGWNTVFLGTGLWIDGGSLIFLNG